MSDENTMEEMRLNLLSSKSKDFLDAALHPEKPWAILMETAYEEATVSLVCLIDGTTSLYFSNGGGVIGAGEDPNISNMSSIMVDSAPFFFLPYTKPADTEKFSYPSKNHVHFYFITDERVLLSEQFEEELIGNNQCGFSPLFHFAHNIIETIRENEENRENSNA